MYIIYSLTFTFSMIVLFILGLYFILHPCNQEGFEGTKMHFRCPNILLEKNSKYYLYNNKLAKVPGVNPIVFDNLNEYTEFIEWQRANGIRCPVLYLQHSYNTQGESVFKARNDPKNIEGGIQDSYFESKLIDAGRENNEVNIGYPGYDPNNEYIGLETPLDKMFDDADNDNISPNPMDSEWGGQDYTNKYITKTESTRTQNTKYISKI
mgnify:CR=1 FL=1